MMSEPAQADQTTTTTAQNVVSALLLAATVGGLLGAAVYAVRQLRATQHFLASIDLGAALLTADAKIDGPLRARLGELASAGHFELLRNETNQGFLRSVNRGIDLDPDADIVLLNSDTEVFGLRLVIRPVQITVRNLSSLSCLMRAR